MASDYTRSEHITDRSSKFIGFFSGSLSRSQLQNLAEIQTATHKMAAWRIPSNQTTLSQSGHTTIITGYDEDGEKGSGWRLKRLLIESDITGVVMVARWYGGVMLGPRRWEHIDDVAREAISKWKTKHKPGMDESVVNHNSTPQNPNQLHRDELIAELNERDKSIAVLRSHLDQKRAALGKSPPSSSHSSTHVPSPGKVPNYFAMALGRLQALEKARDASIAYLLQELDKVDEEQKEEDDIDTAFKEVSDRRELEDAWNAMEEALAEEQAGTLLATNGKRKRSQEDFLADVDEDDDAFEEAWEANESLLSPKKNKAVQVNDGDLPPSPSRKRAKRPNFN